MLAAILVKGSWKVYLFPYKIVFKKERKDFNNNFDSRVRGPRGPSRSYIYVNKYPCQYANEQLGLTAAEREQNLITYQKRTLSCAGTFFSRITEACSFNVIILRNAKLILFGQYCSKKPSTKYRASVVIDDIRFCSLPNAFGSPQNNQLLRR